MGLSLALFTLAAEHALGAVMYHVESFPSKARFGRDILGSPLPSSNGSELYSGAVESNQSCAAVYGPDSLQEKWLGFGVFPSFPWVSFSFASLHSLPSHVPNPKAQLAHTGSFLPGNGKELGNIQAGASHHPSAHWAVLC